MSQSRFGQAGGVGRASQFLYESGDRDPNAEYLVRISELGVNVDWVLFGEGLDSATGRRDDNSSLSIVRARTSQILRDRENLGLPPVPRERVMDHVVSTLFSNDFDNSAEQVG